MVLGGFVGGFVGGFGWFWVVLLVVLGRFGWFCRWFWVVLLVVLGGFGWFWVVLGGFGWFRVLVTTNFNIVSRKSLEIQPCFITRRKTLSN